MAHLARFFVPAIVFASLWLPNRPAVAQSGDELAPPVQPQPAQDAPEAQPAENQPAQTPPAQTQPAQTQPAGQQPPPQGTVWNQAPTAPSGYGQAYPPQQQAQPQNYQYQPTYPAQPVYAGRSRRVRIRYTEGMEVPPGAVLVDRRKRGLLISGAAVFAGSYGLSAVVASLGAELAIFAVPIVGPWIFQARDGDSETLGASIIAGVAQIAGITLFALGMRKTRYLEYWTADVAGRRLAVLPSFSHEHFGLSLSLL